MFQSGKTSERPIAVARLRLRVMLFAAALAGLGCALSPAFGEPDSARFLFGLWRWLAWGRASGHIYDLNFSAGYYAFFAALIHALRLSLPLVPALLKLASALAYIALAGLAFELGRLWLEPRLAAWAALAWCFTPGVWWLGMEAHPQAPAGALLLLSLWLWARSFRLSTAPSPTRHPPGSNPRRAAFILASFLALLLALLLRADAVLFFPAFLAIGGYEVYAAAPRRPETLAAKTQPPRRARLYEIVWIALGSLLFLGAASLIYLLAKRRLLGPLPGAGSHLERKTAGYILHGFTLLNQPHYVFKQLAPMALSPGLFLAALAGSGMLWLWRHRARAGHPDLDIGNVGALFLMLAAWSLPSYLFWFLVLGNNARHVAFAFLPALWAGLEGWRRFFQSLAQRLARRPAAANARRRFQPSALALVGWLLLFACGLNLWLPPASADLNLAVSANVPGSAWRLRLDEAVMLRLAAHLRRSLQPHGRAKITRAALRPAADNGNLSETDRDFYVAGDVPAAASSPCYLGSPATDPYILADLLLLGARFDRPMPGADLVNWLYLRRQNSPAAGAAAPAPPGFRIYEVYGAWQYRLIRNTARPRCSPIFSLEYTPTGVYHPFFGRRFRRLAHAWLQALSLKTEN